MSKDNQDFLTTMQNALAAFRAEEAKTDLATAEQRLRYVEELAKTQVAERKAAEVRLAESNRPSRRYYLAIGWNEDRGQFHVALSGLNAYGNSPEEACQHFDQLWNEGHYQETI